MHAEQKTVFSNLACDRREFLLFSLLKEEMSLFEMLFFNDIKEMLIVFYKRFISFLISLKLMV